MGETLILLAECVRKSNGIINTVYMDAFNDAIDTTVLRELSRTRVDSLGQIIRLLQSWGSLIEL